MNENRFKQIQLEYADPTNLLDTYTVLFNLRPYNIVGKWANKVSIAQKKYSIDAPNRFHGFYSRDESIKIAVDKINATIDVINSVSPLVDRHLTNIQDQDTLNYLHHIFEIHHGLLDRQDANNNVLNQHLANLNIQVHECEDVGRSLNSHPCHFVTWYKMPKIGKLEDSDYGLFDDVSKSGTIYLLYTEIGKTLEDLAADNDNYIHNSAFKPFIHYSADFMVKFYNDDINVVKYKRKHISEYYDKNKEFFLAKGLPWGHPHLTSGLIPLADAVNQSDNVVDEIKKRQYIKTVTLI